MSRISRRVLHYTGEGSDKVYIVDVTQTGKNFIVSVQWGKRTAASLTQKVELTTPYSMTAESHAARIANKKIAKGYKALQPGIAVAGLAGESIATVVSAGSVGTVVQRTTPKTVKVENYENSFRKLKL